MIPIFRRQGNTLLSSVIPGSVTDALDPANHHVIHNVVPANIKRSIRALLLSATVCTNFIIDFSNTILWGNAAVWQYMVLKIPKILPNFLHWSKNYNSILPSWGFFLFVILECASCCGCLNYPWHILQDCNLHYNTWWILPGVCDRHNQIKWIFVVVRARIQSPGSWFE